MTQCDVCCEIFNKSSHSRVVCPYCPFSSCSSCTGRYLLETPDDAHCMNCRKGWSREILVNNFTQKFVSTTYKQRREAVLLERERSLMPATQPYVEIQQKIRHIISEILKVRAVYEMENTNWTLIANMSLAGLVEQHQFESEFEARLYRSERTLVQHKIVACLSVELQHLERTHHDYIQRFHGGQIDQERRQFVRACPYEDCKGFLSTAWKCGMCENWTCPDCHEVRGQNRDDEHVCDPNNLATAQLLAKDSRNCPKCAAMIFKINGCDQMYCTQCHTAFSWRTGRVETGVVHNPHYYEYQRVRGTLARNPGDVPCGGFPDWPTVARLVPRTDAFWNKIASAHRSHGHCTWFLLPRYTVDANGDNRDLRIKLMIGDINEDEFKRKIQQREKARHRKTDIRQVIEMYQAVLNDLFQSFVSDHEMGVLVDSLAVLRNHTLETLGSISKRYSKCVVPTISENFELN